METYEFIIAIVAIVMAAGIIRQVIIARQKKYSSGPDKETLARLDKVEKLEKRVAVLEKIVTNKKASLAEEIDSL